MLGIPFSDKPYIIFKPLSFSIFYCLAFLQKHRWLNWGHMIGHHNRIISSINIIQYQPWIKMSYRNKLWMSLPYEMVFLCNPGWPLKHSLISRFLNCWDYTHMTPSFYVDELYVCVWSYKFFCSLLWICMFLI